ncbi:MAG: ribonuclease H-like domain-containing protein [Natronomonas sp.]
MSDSLSVLSVPAAVCEASTPPAVRDAVRYFEPSLVVVPGGHSGRVYATLSDAVTETPVVYPRLARGGDPIVRYRSDAAGCRRLDDPPATETTASAIDLLAVRDVSLLADLESHVDPGRTDAATYLFLPGLCVETDTTALSAELPDAERIAEAAAAFAGQIVVLAGGQPAGYHHVWSLSTGDDTVDVPVVGVGTEPHDGTLSRIECSAHGDAAVTPIGVDSFGLRALSGVGSETARRLREIGCRRRSDLRDRAVADLAQLSGVSRTTAARMQAHADVIESGEPLVVTNETPIKTRHGRPPLCLDVETDGLTPTIIWQFGVYDPETDEYHAFTERETPNDPTDVLSAFLTWLLGTHADRTLLTWNGHRFDYPQIERFIRRYHPEFLEAWTELWTYDLYDWAVREENALLPGRTNRLEDVAAAIGHEGSETGLSGAATAAAYRRFMRNPDDPAAEPAWDRHESYCEDDCRALWAVYRAIEDADRRDVTDSGDGGAAGRQAGLTDF